MESQDVYTKQQRIAELAELHPELSFTSLAYHIDLEWLKEAYRRTRKDAAVGVDEVTAAEYEAELEGNLRSLLERFKSGDYFAPPVRRVYIPKDDGKQKRPLGIPTLEDKVLQRAVVMLLTPIYEQDFLDCSYAFRPRRSVHQALGELRKMAMVMRGFFRTISLSRMSSPLPSHKAQQIKDSSWAHTYRSRTGEMTSRAEKSMHNSSTWATALETSRWPWNPLSRASHNFSSRLEKKGRRSKRRRNIK